MRVAFLLGLIALPWTAKAFLIERDTCSSIQCNAPGCEGTNNFLPDGRGQCNDGPCVGQACSSVCPLVNIACSSSGCAALYSGNETWTCSSGDYAGCGCANSCPTTLPQCSDTKCAGSSNNMDQYGICGSAELSDCACINSCPSSPGSCSDDDCQGLNDPDGDDSICTAGPRTGCACKSSCPKEIVRCDKSDCQGFNNKANPGSSTCTAGSQVGCRCQSLCSADSLHDFPGLDLSCTAPGCNGVNNLNGSEFCTGGARWGCSCDSKCPKTQLSCSDAANCDGFEGKCTLGIAMGCECSGGTPSRRRWPTRTNAARSATTTTLTGPDFGVPSAYYVCAPRGANTLNPSPNTRSYPRIQINQALAAALIHANDETVVRARNGRTYPERFFARGSDIARFGIPTNDRRVNANRLLEFPIIRNDFGQYIPFAEGGDQGPDRVVFDGYTGRFAAIVTHRGEINNRFHRAPGHDQEVNAPPLQGLQDYYLGPTTMDGSPYPWLGGGGSGGFPFKRELNSSSSPATYATTYDGCPSSSGQCYCYDTGTTFPRDVGLQAIEQACNDWNGQAVPAPGSTTNPKTLSTTKQVNGYSIELSVWNILLATASESKVDKQSCMTALLSAMDNCQTDTTDKKIGGQYHLQIDGVGSQMYVIHPGGSISKPRRRMARDVIEMYRRESTISRKSVQLV